MSSRMTSSSSCGPSCSSPWAVSRSATASRTAGCWRFSATGSAAPSRASTFTLSYCSSQLSSWCVSFALLHGSPLICVRFAQVISTFISHTIASVLLVPIAKEVGASMPGDRSNLLIFITGLICSTGMGMPVSGFPNQTAYVRVGSFWICDLHCVCSKCDPGGRNGSTIPIERRLPEERCTREYHRDICEIAFVRSP